MKTYNVTVSHLNNRDIYPIQSHAKLSLMLCMVEIISTGRKAGGDDCALACHLASLGELGYRLSTWSRDSLGLKHPKDSGQPEDLLSPAYVLIEPVRRGPAPHNEE